MEDAEGRRARVSPLRCSDRVRGLVGTVVLVAWFAEQLRHDALHYFGYIPKMTDPDLFWPVSSMSMFAAPTKEASFAWTALLALYVLGNVFRNALCASPVECRK